MNDFDERSLIVRAQQGECDAFNRLVKHFQKRIYRAVFPLMGNAEDAMDVTQETFLRAYHALKRFEPGRPFYPWIYRIARNLGLSALSKKHRAGFTLSLETPVTEDEQPIQLADSDQNPREEAYQAEIQKRLAEALESLKPEDREILFLKDFNQHSYQEIAEIVDIPIGTVMSRLYYARERLRQKMEQYL